MVLVPGLPSVVMHPGTIGLLATDWFIFQFLQDVSADELKIFPSSSCCKLEKTKDSQPTHQHLISHESENLRDSGLQAHLPIHGGWVGPGGGVLLGIICLELQFSEIREQSVNYEPSVG